MKLTDVEFLKAAQSHQSAADHHKLAEHSRPMRLNMKMTPRCPRTWRLARRPPCHRSGPGRRIAALRSALPRTAERSEISKIRRGLAKEHEHEKKPVAVAR